MDTPPEATCDFALDSDGHHGICAYCGEGGDIILCDAPSCPFSFHIPCLATLHAPPPPDDEATPWRCPPCSGKPLPPDAAYTSWSVLMKRWRRAAVAAAAEAAASGRAPAPSPLVLSGDRVRVFKQPKSRGAAIPVCLLPCANGATWVSDGSMVLRAPASFIWRGALGGGQPAEAAALLAGGEEVPSEVRAAFAAPNAAWVRDWSVLTHHGSAATSLTELARRTAVAVGGGGSGGGSSGSGGGGRSGSGSGAAAAAATKIAAAPPLPPATLTLTLPGLSQKRARSVTDRYVAAPLQSKRRPREEGSSGPGGGGSSLRATAPPSPPAPCPPLLGSHALPATLGPDSHSFFCAACEDGGSRLMLCEACPRIMHARCVATLRGKVPAWAWLCPVCEEGGRGYYADEVNAAYDGRMSVGGEGVRRADSGGKGLAGAVPQVRPAISAPHDAQLASALEVLRAVAWARLRAEGWVAGGRVQVPDARGLAVMAWEREGGAASEATGRGTAAAASAVSAPQEDCVFLPLLQRYGAALCALLGGGSGSASGSTGGSAAAAAPLPEKALPRPSVLGATYQVAQQLIMGKGVLDGSAAAAALLTGRPVLEDEGRAVGSAASLSPGAPGSTRALIVDAYAALRAAQPEKAAQFLSRQGQEAVVLQELEQFPFGRSGRK